MSGSVISYVSKQMILCHEKSIFRDSFFLDIIVLLYE